MSTADSKHLDDLRDIKNIMQKSSRFVSLSGWSGISAGICALIGAWYASTKVDCWRSGDCDFISFSADERAGLNSTLLHTALFTFVSAFLFSIIFTYFRSQKAGTPIWNFTARRLLVNVAIPIIVGGIFIYKMLTLGHYELLLPASLIFYGLSLVNAGKYTLGEVSYLGYGELILGLIGCWATDYGLYIWAAGFGVLHIIYGMVMWYKYERSSH